MPGLNPWPRSVTLFDKSVGNRGAWIFFHKKEETVGERAINFGILDSFSREITTIRGGDRIVISAVDSLRRFFPRFRFRKKAEEFRPAVERWNCAIFPAAGWRHRPIHGRPVFGFHTDLALSSPYSSYTASQKWRLCVETRRGKGWKWA